MTMAESKTLAERFLTWFGDLKYFRYPLFLVWDPGSYRVRGEDAREVIGLVQPGDILLRSYEHYVDGWLIPGRFSHVGLYLGAVTEADRRYLGTDPTPAATAAFRTGEQMVIHAMAEGVFMEDVLNFCRCDQLLILRLPEALTPVPATQGYRFRDTLFTAAERQLRQGFAGNKGVPRSAAVALAREVALAHLGVDYDFAFDFATHKAFSCTEFVYFCYRAIDRFIGLAPKPRRLLWLTRQVIEPDDFYRAGLLRVWQSRSLGDWQP